MHLLNTEIESSFLFVKEFRTIFDGSEIPAGQAPGM